MPKEEESKQPGTAIDATPLSKRLEECKRHHAAELPESRNAFKKPLMVEQRREAIAQLAFFQKPAEPEPPEKDDGLTCMFV